MDPAQYGESSRSPRARSISPRKLLIVTEEGIENGNGTHSKTVSKSRLILPTWDVPPLKPLHPSHDLISLLSLAPLYNTYVRPYASGIEEDPGSNNATGTGGGEVEVGSGDDVDMTSRRDRSSVVESTSRKKGGKGGMRGQKLEKGYIGLLDDCIDPTPNGTKAPPSLVNLIQDLSFPPTGQAPDLWEGPIEVLPADSWNIARLEVGNQTGYKGGEKQGVKLAEEKRRRKRENKAKALQQNLLPNPNTEPSTPNGPLSRSGSMPNTPLLPVLPPSRSGPAFGPGAGPNQQANSGVRNLPNKPLPPPTNSSSQTYSGPRPAGFRPNTPGGQAPGSGMKRVYEGGGAGMSKKAKLAGTRSASPMPSGSGNMGNRSNYPGQGPTQGQGQAQGSSQVQGQGQSGARNQPQGQLRPGFGKGNRARTEGM